MATCTFEIGTADTGLTANTSGAFVPATNDLLVVFVTVSASVDATPTLSSSIGGFTFARITSVAHNAGANTTYLFISNALVSDTSSQTVTWTHASDQGTGSNIMVYAVSGMTKTGATAALQTASNSAAAGTTPSVTFAGSCLTGNPTLGALGNVTSPAGITPPTSWTEPAGGDIGYTSPTTGTAVCHRDSGFTGTVVTWAALSPSAWGTLMVELDTSATVAGIGTRKTLLGVGR